MKNREIWWEGGGLCNGVMHRGITEGVGINVWIVWISFKNGGERGRGG